MSTLSNEADGAAMMTPKATGRASAAPISKEDERRRKLQEWQESKASEKKAVAPERKAVPDRKAQFFERRERRLEEERKKRMSRSGQENGSSTPIATMTNPRSKVPSSAVASRLLSTPRPGQGPEGEGRLIGTTPVSAARGPPPRPRQAATTPSSLVRSASSSHADTVAAATTTTASAGARGLGGEEATCTPSRFSALLRPKASPYKEKSHPNALKAAASGIDQTLVRSSTAPGDRLSGQLATLGAAGACSRWEGQVGGGSDGGGGVAVGVAARRETFQASRASSTTDPGVADVVRARPVLRRASSAMLGSEVVGDSGGVDRRRLASSVAAQRNDQHQGPYTPVAATAAVATTSAPKTSEVQPLHVSSRSPNAPPTARLQLHPINATPKQNAVLSDESSSTSTTAAPAPALTPVIVPKSVTVLAGETNAASGADVAQGQERKAAKTVPAPDVVQEPVPAKAVLPGGTSESVAAVLQTGTTKTVGSEESRRVEKVARSKVVAVLAQDGATTAVAAAAAAATVAAVDKKDAGEARRSQAPSPSSSPRPSSDEKLMSYEGEEGVGQGAGLIACESKPDTKIVEKGQKLAVCEGVAKGAAAMPTEAVLAPAKLKQTRGASLPAPPALTAAAEATSGATTAAAVDKEGEGESAAEDGAPAAIPSPAEVAAVLDESGSVMDQKLSLFSRFSSVFSRGQQPAAIHDRAGDESSSFSLAAEVQSIPDEGSPSASNLDNTGEKSLVVPARGAKSTRKVDGYPAVSPSAADNKLREENPARESPDETKALVARTSKEAQEKAAATSPAAARFSGSTKPENRSESSAPPAGRTNSPREEGRIGSARQAALQATAASPHRPRPALTPPGYRSRSSPPSADSTDGLREEGSVEPTKSRGSKEATTRGPPGSRATGLTPPGYMSRLSPPSAGKPVFPRELGGKENGVKSSAGARSSGLTRPGYRSCLSPLSAGGMDSPSRESLVKDPASGGLSSVLESGAVKLTPERRHVGAPACARQAGGLEGTPPRRGVSPPLGVSSPAQPPLEQPPLEGSKQDRSRGTVPAGEDEHERAEAREKAGGCSSIGRDGVAGGPQDGVGQQSSPPCIVKGRASTQPLLVGVLASPGTSSPAQQQQQQQQRQQQQRQQHAVQREGKEKVQTKDTACSPMTRSSSRESAAGGSLEAASRAKQQQRSPRSNAAAIGARKGEQKEHREQTKQDTVRSPIARDGAGPMGAGAPECSTPRLGAARVASTPPAARSAAGALEDTSAGVGSPGAADAQTLSSGGRAAARASASPPPLPPPKDEEGKGQEDGSPRGFHCSPNFAAGFVAGRRKRRAVSGVPVITAAAAAEAVAESPVSGNGDGGRRASLRLERAKQSREERKGGGGAGEEQEGEGESSSGESDSSWETCSSSEEEEGEEEWGGLSYLDEINQHPYTGGVVIDPDLVRSGSSSNGGGSTRSSLLRSSFGEARSGGRRSWGSKASLVVTAEMGTQTGDGEGVKHALVQAGDGKLLSEAELQDECNQRELKERLEMMNHDRLSEVFHREILKQEEAQERKRLNEKHEAEQEKLSAKHEAECLELRGENEALRLAHNNEKIRIRWEHMDELARVEAEAGDGAGLLEELQEERRLREQDKEHHEAAQQKERQQRREWEARCDDHVRDKREQAKRHAEELRSQVAAERKKLEGAFKRKLERHREARKKAEEMVKEQLQALKEIDQENDELREENAQLREKLSMEVEEDGEGEEEGS